MTKARSSLISLADTPYYHVVGRCVRRAFLCGVDRHTHQDYSHRKQWIVARLKALSSIFTIDICAYAVMSNHYHLVVHVDEKRAQTLSETEVCQRWQKLFHLPVLAKNYLNHINGETSISVPEIVVAQSLIASWRERLSDLSWYMRCQNEHIARKANEEDACTGRFWEGRFKSQAILDEAGLLACMVYVDLNPIRAGIAPTPETSVDTSIYQRIQDWHKEDEVSGEEMPQRPITENASNAIPLLAFAEKMRQTDLTQTKATVPYPFIDYVQLVDWTGRALRDDKRGAIAQNAPRILSRLGIAPEDFVKGIMRKRLKKGRAVGAQKAMQLFAADKGVSYVRGWRV